jgi:hypothetical protein
MVYLQKTFLLLCILSLTACNLVLTPTATPSPVPLPQVETATSLPADTPTLASTPLLVTPSSLAATTVAPANSFPTPVTSDAAVILAPLNGSTVSGTLIALNGVVNNLSQDEFTLELLDATGNVINRQVITLRNPNRVPQVEWSASLFTQYRGQAVVRLVVRDRQGQSFVAATVNIIIGA